MSFYDKKEFDGNQHEHANQISDTILQIMQAVAFVAPIRVLLVSIFRLFTVFCMEVVAKAGGPDTKDLRSVRTELIEMFTDILDEQIEWSEESKRIHAENERKRALANEASNN